ncbi:MAG: hypothetical protein HQK66_00230 [Desulfamplus sp.]|nr:hypothetical protein [Desulfamplus sp.]
MEFIFSCPETGKTFSTEDFSIMDGQRVFTDAEGRKSLNATIILENPCPLCGKTHEYAADEMICPFTPSI